MTSELSSPGRQIDPDPGKGRCKLDLTPDASLSRLPLTADAGLLRALSSLPPSSWPLPGCTSMAVELLEACADCSGSSPCTQQGCELQRHMLQQHCNSQAQQLLSTHAGISKPATQPAKHL